VAIGCGGHDHLARWQLPEEELTIGTGALLEDLVRPQLHRDYSVYERLAVCG
jgi:hypothetical protein